MKFKGSDIELFWIHPERFTPRRVPPNYRKALYMKLQILDAACDLKDLRIPPNNRLEKLKGDRAGQYGIRVNSQWRLFLLGSIKDPRGLSSVTAINSYISTPGEILIEEFLEPMGISQYRLAKAIHKPQSAISDTVHGRRSITTEMAWLLSQALGTTPEFWLNLEMTYQIKTFDSSKLPPVVACC